MSTPSPNRRERLDQWLQAHPLVVEYGAAAAGGVCGAAAGFGMGVALGNFAMTLVLALICGVVGAITGCYLSALSLVLTYMVLIVIYPARWWFPVLATLMAVAGVIVQAVLRNLAMPEILICFAVYLVLSLVAIEFANGFVMLIRSWVHPRPDCGG